jgi:hypothetical protein
MSKSLIWLLIGSVLGFSAGGLIFHGFQGLRAGSASPASDSPGVPVADAVDQMREIFKRSEALQRVSGLASLLPHVDPKDAPVVAEVFETSPFDSGDPELVLFGIWWAEHEPGAAYAWTTTDWRARHANVIAAVVRSWAHRDPKVALAAARGLPFANQRDLATDAAIIGWDESGQPGLLEAMQQFNNIEFQQSCEALARRRVIALGAEGALRWLDSLPAGTIHDVLSMRVASAAAADKRGATVVADWARPKVTEGSERPSGFPRRIGMRWVQHDPDQAMAWLASLPAGADRDDGVSDAFRAWLRRDAVAAHGWIEKTGVQAWNEPAIAVYARAISWERPKEAIELARRITNESSRESTTVAIGQVWFGKEPEAARAWLASADVPEETRRNATMTHNTNPANQAALERFQRMHQGVAGDRE